jgi:hypothetical protein
MAQARSHTRRYGHEYAFQRVSPRETHSLGGSRQCRERASAKSSTSGSVAGSPQADAMLRRYVAHDMERPPLSRVSRSLRAVAGRPADLRTLRLAERRAARLALVPARASRGSRHADLGRDRPLGADDHAARAGGTPSRRAPRSRAEGALHLRGRRALSRLQGRGREADRARGRQLAVADRVARTGARPYLGHGQQAPGLTLIRVAR